MMQAAEEQPDERLGSDFAPLERPGLVLSGVEADGGLLAATVGHVREATMETAQEGGTRCMTPGEAVNSATTSPPLLAPAATHADTAADQGLS